MPMVADIRARRNIQHVALGYLIVAWDWDWKASKLRYRYMLTANRHLLAI